MRRRMNKHEIRCTAKILKQGRVIKEYPTTYLKHGYVVRMFKKKLRDNPNDPIVDEISKGEYVIITDGEQENVSYPVKEFLEMIQDTDVQPKDRRPKVERKNFRKVKVGDTPIRIFMLNDEPYAVGKDVAHAFGYNGNVINMINSYLSNVVKVLVPINDTDFDDYYPVHALNIPQILEFSKHYKYLKDSTLRENMANDIVKTLNNLTNEIEGH